MTHKAIIYCRVSSERQASEGHGLDSQEHRCKQYAEQKGYEVLKVFRDEGISGGLIDRPAMNELLQFLETHDVFSEEKIIVIIDDIKRFARDVMGHIQLKSAIYSRNGILESPNHKFEETPEGEFIELMFAATAQLERKQNTRQVRHRMRARLEQGYWTFDWPPGMKTEKFPGHGKLLVPTEPKASIIKEALEGYASGRFVTRTDVQNFLDTKDFFHRKKSDKVHLEQAIRVLERAWIYAGFIEYPKWKIPRRKGHHQALISEATLKLIEDRLETTSPRPHRKDLDKDFALRGYAACEDCGELMTASWSKGRTQMYPYYRCTTKSCVRRNKGMRKAYVDNAFQEKLLEMSATPGALKLLGAVFNDVWKDRIKDVEKSKERKKSEIEELEKKIVDLVEKIENTKSAAVVKRYELRIEELELEKRNLRSQVAPKNDTRNEFGTALTKVLNFLQNPSALWNSDNLEDKKTVLRLAFVSVVPFSKENGVGTASFSLLFELSKLADTDKKAMVEMPRIELGSNV